MMKNRCIILLSFVLVMSIACANTITSKDADIRSGSGTEAKYQIAQSNKSDFDVGRSMFDVHTFLFIHYSRISVT